jgi:hypothetical protein
VCRIDANCEINFQYVAGHLACEQPESKQRLFHSESFPPASIGQNSCRLLIRKQIQAVGSGVVPNKASVLAARPEVQTCLRNADSVVSD